MPVKPHYAVSFAIPDAKTDHIVRKMFDLPYASLSGPKKWTFTGLRMEMVPSL